MKKRIKKKNILCLTLALSMGVCSLTACQGQSANNIGESAVSKSVENTLNTEGTDTNSAENNAGDNVENDTANNGKENARYGRTNSGDSSNDSISMEYDNSENGGHAIHLDGEEKSFSSIHVTKSGDSEGDEADFYGENAAVFAENGAKLTIEDSEIESNGTHANGVFSYGEGTIVNISDSLVETKGNCSGGIMTTGGGTMNAENLSIHTSGNSSAAIRSDRGGGVVKVVGGTYTTDGTGSPVIYSTANISVSSAQLKSNASQGIVIEGKNSVSLDDVVLIADNNKKNSDKSSYYQAVMIYQSMSGDASIGTSSFSAKDGSITNKNGDIFFINNTACEISLSNVDIINEDHAGIFLRAEAAGWGREGSNGGKVNFNASDQKIDGDIVVGDTSVLNLYLKEGSELVGAINTNNTGDNIADNASDNLDDDVANNTGDNTSDNAGGNTSNNTDDLNDSGNPNVYVEIDKDSTWKLTADSYISALSCDEGAIELNEHKLFVNGQEYIEGSNSSGEAFEIVTEKDEEDRGKGGQDGRGSDRNKPGGDRPDGERPDGEKPNGEEHNGGKPGGERPSGEKPSGDRSGDIENGDGKLGGDKPDGEKPDGERLDEEKPGRDRPDGEIPDGEGHNGGKPGGEKPDGNDENKSSEGENNGGMSAVNSSNETYQEVGLDPNWNYAYESKINTGTAHLYKSTSSKANGKTVCVNAGHGTSGGERVKTYCHPDHTPKVTGGSTQAGAVTAASVSSGTQMLDGTAEAVVNLQLAMVLKEKLLAAGYDVLMIRESDDVQLDNIARTVIANNMSDCHLALHYDSSTNDKGAYFTSVPNIASYKNMEPVASHWQQHDSLGKNVVQGMREAGVKIFSSGEMGIDLTQTSYSTVPSIDLELGDRASDWSLASHDIIASGIVLGLNHFFGIS